MNLDVTIKDSLYIKERDSITRNFSKDEWTLLEDNQLFKPYTLDAIANIEDDSKRLGVLNNYLMQIFEPAGGKESLYGSDEMDKLLVQMAFNVDKFENLIRLDDSKLQYQLSNYTKNMLGIKQAVKIGIFDEDYMWPYVISSINYKFIPDILNKLESINTGAKTFILDFIRRSFISHEYAYLIDENCDSFIEHIDIKDLQLEQMAYFIFNLVNTIRPCAFLNANDVYIEASTKDICTKLEPYCVNNKHWADFKTHVLLLDSVDPIDWEEYSSIFRMLILSNTFNTDTDLNIGFEI